ncbi:NADH-quinone oxidoreductase subunit NuoG [Bradyrhizobium sp.]|uniref:NADH-quinone oxidoreductase subunit NuoG n=1 Tax=Bradyrhizobium sp. TaxID=376 RepID=UPI003C3D880A
MPRINIDGTDYDVAAGRNLLQACLSLGINLPYFCWHPAMGSVGACRQCAVKQFHGDDDQHGRIVMACMVETAEGARISIGDPEAVKFRASVIEWLMTNHPHDCPVCEEGGECHLQDMTLMTGHAYRRYRFKKRTFRNQYLGPFITHEMNRCIACYRCVRFYREYAGGRDFDVFAAHNHVYFGRHEDGVLENEFSGNLAEVCPTGVFDDKPFAKIYERKWDLRGTPSVCVHCALGCNTTPNERYGKARRILNRYNGEVNGYFLCDRGRFGFDFVNSPLRLRQPLLRRDAREKPEPATKAEVLRRLKELLSLGKAVGIGSPRASLEANFALRELVGAERFYLGLSSSEQELLALIIDGLQRGPARAASLKNAEQADAVLILGEDVPDTAPRLALSLRQAIRQRSLETADRMKIPRWQDAAVRNAAQQERSPLFIATPDATRLDDVATYPFRGAPADLARLGFAVAHEIDPASAAVPDLSDEVGALARQIAETLRNAERPLVVTGTGCASAAVIQAAANVAWALCGAGRAAELSFAVPECNSLGLSLIGGGTLHDAFEAVEQGAAEMVIVLENDLYRRAERAAVDRCLDRARYVVVIDHLLHETARNAEIVLPAGAFTEAEGTLVSNEGRAQRFFQLLVPEGGIQESWQWLRDLLDTSGRDPGWTRLDEVTAACANALPTLASIPLVAPGANFRVNGAKIRRETHRSSGRTAIHAAATVHEPKPPEDPDSPLSYTMEGYYGPMPSALVPYFWAPSWNSVRAVNKFQDEVGGSLRGGDPGIRLIEPTSHTATRYYDEVPEAFAKRDGEWLILPLHEIFGSEELSRLAPAVAERVPQSYLALNADDAASLHIAEGAMVAVDLGGDIFHLPVRVRPDLPSGVAGMFVGLSGSIGPLLPAWGNLTVEPGAVVGEDGHHE